MSRITNYSLDYTVNDSDKLLGTDGATNNTKNFPLSSVRDWLNASGGIKIIGQSNYTFQSEGDRQSGTISLESLGGDGLAFSEITELIFSEVSASGVENLAYVQTLVGRLVLIADLDDQNNFGVYNLTAYEQLEGSSGFYRASLSLTSGNGTLRNNGSYGFSAWGILSDTSARTQIDMESEDGSLFTIVVSNDAQLLVIPEGSTDAAITSPPVITGTEKVWCTLGAIAGGVTGSPAPVRTWQWQRSTTGLNWDDIAGATNATYTLTADDANKYVRVQQTETNVLESATAASNPTGLIQESIFSTTTYANIQPVTWGELTVQTWD